MIVLARAINGICINGYEYILDDRGNVMGFGTTNEAISYLNREMGLELTTEEEVEEELGISIIIDYDE